MPAVRPGAKGAVISGWGTALPPKTLTNQDLADMGLATSDEWIIERTGIRQRQIGGTTAGLSAEAGRLAIGMSGLDPDSIDAIVLATTTPDRAVPATSATVANELGMRCGAFDVNAACSGFTYALVVAHGLIAQGAERLLVIGTDTLHRITDWEDRNTAVLFADGAGAIVLEAVDGGGQLLSWDLDADGSAERYLYAELGGYLVMDGKEVFRRAVRIMVDSAQKSLTAAGLGAGDVSLVVPHQANVRIIEAACNRLRIPMERAAIVLDRTGNTSSASIPLALVDAIENDRVHEGDLVLLVGFGAGMTAASAADPLGRGVTDAAAGGRVVLVTGGSRGIGLAIAQRFAALGDRVAVTYRSADPPAGLFAVKCDVTSSGDVDAAFGAVEEHFGGPVEVLVSNAGMTKDMLLLRMGEDDFTAVIDANLTAAYRVSKRAAQGMLRARKGRIVLVSSVVALLGSAGQANYAASKAGMVGFARSLARELGSRSITVNVVAPGPVETDMTAALGEKRLAELTAAVPLGRMASPDEIAGTVVFLASPDAAYITGAVIPVDGGLGMGH